MDNKLAMRLQELRDSRHWSKTYVAKQLDVKSLSTYANWEYGIRTPSNEMLTKIADLYGVSTDYLLGITDKPEPVREEEEEKKFLQAINDPQLRRWFISLSSEKEEDLRKLRTMWNLIKGENQDE